MYFLLSQLGGQVDNDIQWIEAKDQDTFYKAQDDTSPPAPNADSVRAEKILLGLALSSWLPCFAVLKSFFFLPFPRQPDTLSVWLLPSYSCHHPLPLWIFTCCVGLLWLFLLPIMWYHLPAYADSCCRLFRMDVPRGSRAFVGAVSAMLAICLQLSSYSMNIWMNE